MYLIVLFLTLPLLCMFWGLAGFLLLLIRAVTGGCPTREYACEPVPRLRSIHNALLGGLESQKSPRKVTTRVYGDLN